MLTYDFDESIGFWIFTSASLYERAFNAALAPHGITYRQVQVLGKLIRRGPQPQTILAEEMQIEPPTLVGILDRMEREGWILRETALDDRRKKIIKPGPQAEAVWEKIAVAGRALRARAMAGLAETEIQSLIVTLRKVQDNLKNLTNAVPS